MRWSPYLPNGLLILDSWLALAGSILHIADRPQEMPQLLKARAVWDHPCRDRGRLGVTSLLLASPAGPPHPHLEPGARAARQEVRGAGRKPQEELRSSASPAPTCRALGTLGKPDPAPGKSSQKQVGEGGYFPGF